MQKENLSERNFYFSREGDTHLILIEVTKHILSQLSERRNYDELMAEMGLNNNDKVRASCENRNDSKDPFILSSVKKPWWSGPCRSMVTEVSICKGSGGLHIRYIPSLLAP